VVLCSLAILANSHAVLKVPIPFSANPSKTSPCGGGATAAVASANWQVGSVVSITWQVVAADGAGPLSAIFDVAGTQSFTAAPIALGNPQVVGIYKYNISVPNLTCGGPNKLCTVQFSANGWFSCTSVSLVTTPPVPVDTNPTCQLVNGLSFCSELNGQFVLVPFGQTAAATDASVAATFPVTLYNPNVFATPNSTACANAYHTFLCHNTLPYCGGAAFACKSVCNSAIQLCGITPSHLALYNCDAGPVSCCQNNTQACNPTSQVVQPTIPVGTSVIPIPKVGLASSVVASFLLVILAMVFLF